MSEPRPERIAAAARALGGELTERLALYADALSQLLAEELGLVSWDRQEVIGGAQAAQARLRERRFRHYGGAPVRVVERRLQPLEALEPAWRALRQGRRVRVEFEPGSCSGGLELLRGLSRAMGYGVLGVADEPLERAPGEDTSARYEARGVDLAAPRVALVGADADEELAAYVVARCCLRRSGMDPRAVRVAHCVGSRPRLHRHLLRLFVGARFGPATDPEVFAGPVDDPTRDRYLDALTAWQDADGVEVLCEGGILERAGERGPYLAPALFRVKGPVPDLPRAGPLLVVVENDAESAQEAFRKAARDGLGRLEVLGAKRRATGQDGLGPIRQIRGALLVDRLAPGLPEPRPA